MTYYVDPNKGNDANVGTTSDSPWASFAKVNALSLAPGDKVVIAAGIHSQTLKPSAAGTKEKPVTIQFLPGRHEFRAASAIKLCYFVSNSADAPLKPRPIGILVRNARHLNITGGKDCEICYGDRMTELINDQSEDITYSCLNFDFVRPTVSEFRVLESGANSVLIQIAEGSTYAIEKGRFQWTGDLGPGGAMVQQADPVLKTCWRLGQWDPFATASVEDLGGGKVRLTYKNGNYGMIKGRQFQFRNIERDTTSAVNTRSKDITFRDCNFYALPGMGIVSQFTENIAFRRVNIAPRPGTLRTCPAWADCLQLSGCRGEILVDDCHFSGTQDDPINVHGTHLRIIEKPAPNQVLVRFMQPQTYGIAAFQPGDKVEFVNHQTLRGYAANTVSGIERKTDKDWLLTFERPVADFGKDDVVDNITWYPNITIRNCTVDTDSCRGFLVTTRGKALIDGCTFIRTRMSAILVEDDAEGWFESGPIRDLTVSNNRFIQCGQDGSPVICLSPHNGNNDPALAVHENIRICGNYFDGGGISARSVKGLTITGNRFSAKTLPIQHSACTQVTIDKNELGVADSSTQRSIAFTSISKGTSDNDTDGIPYGVALWNESLGGNHRAVVQVKDPADAVYVRLPWRRQDLSPEKKAVVVFDAKGKQILNVVRGAITREAGEIVFQPTLGAGDYFVYFMPGGNLGAVKRTADAAWLKANKLDDDKEHVAESAVRLRHANVARFESRNEFHRRDSMELIATAKETADSLVKYPQAGYLVFPEDRRYCVRMFNDLPYRWIRRGPLDCFSGEASPNEFYTFQLGIYACRKAISDIRLEFSDLEGSNGSVLPKSSIRCINSGGVDWAGEAFTKPIGVGLGTVKPLWFILNIPENVAAGIYHGTVKLTPVGQRDSNGVDALTPTTIALDIKIVGDPLPYHGCLDAWRMSRLGWLDSTKGEEDTVVKPYITVDWHGNTATILNRTVVFDALGFPTQITAGRHELLTGPVEFSIVGENGPVPFAAGAMMPVKEGKSLVANKWTHQADTLRMEVHATMECDGCLDYRIKLRADKDTTTKDIALDIPMRSEIAEYFMGLAQRGQYAPAKVNWKWNVDQVTNKLWAGNAVGGLTFDMMHNQDIWPTTYNYRNWGVPQSWDNQAKGGCDFTRDAKVARIHAYTGPRTWKAGDEVDFHFHLLITPFKPIDMGLFHYRYCGKEQRHYQEDPNGPKYGANIAHTHHAMGGINPWINYPFLTMDAMKAYRQRLLGYGYEDMDLYYTLREISNHMSEIWALRSLDDEIFSANESITYDEHGGRTFKGGGGYSWLQEHLLTGYAPAWSVGVDGDVDAAIGTQGLSRLHNSYVEGLDLLMQRVGFKGLYLDGLAYDRQIMKRVARVMAKNAPDYRIRFHTGNNFDFAGWHCNGLLQYCEHLAYITDLYIGEGYNYGASPDYWFVEMSGIPFGLKNEMLGGGNAWRGMIYGMDSPENGASPGLWKLWDSFGIQKSQMIGYWDPHCPVKTDHKDILATVYRREGKTLVALASWAEEPHMCRLTVDWKALGLDPHKAKLYAPEVQYFQPSAMTAAADAIPVMPGHGWLLILDEEEHEAPSFQVPNAYAGRSVLFQDAFDGATLKEPWKVNVSKNPAVSLKRDKGRLVITAPANCFAFAERSLPSGFNLVECDIFSGTDYGATWGPGIALIWNDKAALRMNLRTNQCFGIDSGGGQGFAGKVTPNTWYHLRFRCEKEQYLGEISTDGKLWFPIATYQRKQFHGNPVLVRLGKMNGSSDAVDFSPSGPVGSSAFKNFRIYGMLGK
jgi:hypothetical protein